MAMPGASTQGPAKPKTHDWPPRRRLVQNLASGWVHSQERAASNRDAERYTLLQAGCASLARPGALTAPVAARLQVHYPRGPARERWAAGGSHHRSSSSVHSNVRPGHRRVSESRRCRTVPHAGCPGGYRPTRAATLRRPGSGSTASDWSRPEIAPRPRAATAPRPPLPASRGAGRLRAGTAACRCCAPAIPADRPARVPIAPRWCARSTSTGTPAHRWAHALPAS